MVDFLVLGIEFFSFVLRCIGGFLVRVTVFSFFRFAFFGFQLSVCVFFFCVFQVLAKSKTRNHIKTKQNWVLAVWALGVGYRVGRNLYSVIFRRFSVFVFNFSCTWFHVYKRFSLFFFFQNSNILPTSEILKKTANDFETGVAGVLRF